MNLEHLGSNSYFAGTFREYQTQGLTPGRIIRADRRRWIVVTAERELTATMRGKLQKSGSVDDLPTIGGWVALAFDECTASGIIQAVLPRRTRISRKAVSSGGMPESGGRTAEQLLAANIDYLFIVTGLDNDFHLRRIERYLLTAYEGGVTPVIVLNKLDLCDDIASRIAEVQLVPPAAHKFCRSPARKQTDQ